MFLLRSNNRVKYLHGSFIRKMCASNSRSSQWVTLYELDSIKISSGFQAAIIVQGSSAAQALVPAPGWRCFWWQQSIYRVCGPAQPPSSQTQRISRVESFIPGEKTIEVPQDRVIPTKGSRKRSPGSWMASLPLWWPGTTKTPSDRWGQASGAPKVGWKALAPQEHRICVQVPRLGKLSHWVLPLSVFHTGKSPAQPALPLT